MTIFEYMQADLRWCTPYTMNTIFRCPAVQTITVSWMSFWCVPQAVLDTLSIIWNVIVVYVSPLLLLDGSDSSR